MRRALVNRILRQRFVLAHLTAFTANRAARVGGSPLPDGDLHPASP
jgi:hypothetical protein